jgi:hypothetical protein
MLSEPQGLNLKLCSKQYNKIILLHLIVAPQLSGSQQHNYSPKTRQAGHANEQSMYYCLMSMVIWHKTSADCPACLKGVGVYEQSVIVNVYGLIPKETINHESVISTIAGDCDHRDT